MLEEGQSLKELPEGQQKALEDEFARRRKEFELRDLVLRTGGELGPPLPETASLWLYAVLACMASLAAALGVVPHHPPVHDSPVHDPPALSLPRLHTAALPDSPLPSRAHIRILLSCSVAAAAPQRVQPLHRGCGEACSGGEGGGRAPHARLRCGGDGPERSAAVAARVECLSVRLGLQREGALGYARGVS